jgi:hypothetical protein
MGDNRRGAYRVMVRRPEGKRPFGRLRHRREDNIKMEAQDVGWRDRDWIDLTQHTDRYRAL